MLAVDLHLIETEPLACIGGNEHQSHIACLCCLAVIVAIHHLIAMPYILLCIDGPVVGACTLYLEVSPHRAVYRVLYAACRGIVAIDGAHADAYVVQGGRCAKVEKILVVGLLVAVQAGECAIVAVHHVVACVAFPDGTLGQSHRNGLGLRCLGDAEELLGEREVLHTLACLVEEDEVCHVLGGNLCSRGQFLPLLAVGAISCIGQEALVQGDVV